MTSTGTRQNGDGESNPDAAFGKRGKKEIQVRHCLNSDGKSNRDAASGQFGKLSKNLQDAFQNGAGISEKEIQVRQCLNGDGKLSFDTAFGKLS